MSTAQKVIDVLARVTGEPSVRAQQNLALFDHHVLDSLRTIQLLAALSDECGVEIALTEVDRDAWATPGRIVKFMEDRVGA